MHVQIIHLCGNDSSEQNLVFNFPFFILLSNDTSSTLLEYRINKNLKLLLTFRVVKIIYIVYKVLFPTPQKTHCTFGLRKYIFPPYKCTFWVKFKTSKRYRMCYIVTVWFQIIKRSYKIDLNLYIFIVMTMYSYCMFVYGYPD